MRLIDADALTEKYGDWYTEEGTEEGYIGTIRGIVESAPTIYDAPAAQPEIIRCKDCIYYDPPHIENNGERYEYKDMPKEAFDIFGIGVSCEYGINVGGRCERDYNAGYDDDKRVFVPESNFCGRARRRTNGSD